MALELASGFEIIYCSDDSYEEMTVEILYRHQQVLQINKDKGIGSMEASLYNQYVFQEMKIDLTFGLNDFLEAVETARKMLVVSDDLSNGVIPRNIPDDFKLERALITKNTNTIINVIYKKTVVAQIIDDENSGITNLHILAEYVKPELLSETKFFLDDFIEALSQAKNNF